MPKKVVNVNPSEVSQAQSIRKKSQTSIRTDHLALGSSLFGLITAALLKQASLSLCLFALPLYIACWKQTSSSKEIRKSLCRINEDITKVDQASTKLLLQSEESEDRFLLPSHIITKAVHKTSDKSRVAIFIDDSNIFPAARKHGKKNCYQKLKNLLSEGYELDSVNVYLSVDPSKGKEVDFANALRRQGYRIIEKSLTRHKDGKKEGNLDPEIIRDLLDLRFSGAYDVAILVSGDGDFSCIVEYLIQRNSRVEVVAYPQNTSRELRRVANRFIDITKLPVFVDKHQRPKVRS